MNHKNEIGLQGYRHRVLLVDDNPGLIGRLQNLFVSKGYLCETALSWREALELISHQVVDLVVCDYRLKGKNGINLINEARSVQKEKGGVPGVVLCNFGDLKSVLQEVQYSSGVRYLTRPFQDDTLLVLADEIIKDGKHKKVLTADKSAEKSYLLDHRIYSHSAMKDLDGMFPGITYGCWDDAVDKEKWQRKPR